MKIYTIVFFILSSITTDLFSQEKVFFVKDENQLPIENVYVISEGKPITLSDKTGKVTLTIEVQEYITLRHISYETKEIRLQAMEGNSITMANRMNTLQEARVLSPTALENIVKECSKRLDSNYPKDELRYFKINHKSTSQNEIITLLQGNLKISPDNGEFVDNNTHIKRLYFETKNSLEDNNFISPINIFRALNFNRFNFLTDVKKYNYTLLSSDSTEYQISFLPKEPSKFTYEGKMIMDRNDYGIRLIDIELVSSDKNIRTTVINNFKPTDMYNFNKEKIQLFFQKKEKKYYLESGFYVASMNQLNTSSKIKQPRLFFTQSILMADDGKTFGTPKRFSLNDLASIDDTKLQKTKIQPTSSQRKIKEKVEKYIQENEQD